MIFYGNIYYVCEIVIQCENLIVLIYIVYLSLRAINMSIYLVHQYCLLFVFPGEMLLV